VVFYGKGLSGRQAAPRLRSAAPLKHKDLDLLKIAFLMCLLGLAARTVCRAQESAATVPAEQPEVKTAAPDPPVADAASAHKKSFLQRMFSVQAVTATVPGAIVQQVHDWPEEWGKRHEGFEKRVASLYGQFVLGVAIEDGVKAIDHEDNAYRRLGKGNFFRRTAHVITDTVTARKPDGSRMFAYSLPANEYGSWAIATLWSPREYRTAESILEWGSAGVGVYAGTNLAREFWPDIKSVFRKKKKN
jgi:hypothetical protein